MLLISKKNQINMQIIKMCSIFVIAPFTLAGTKSIIAWLAKLRKLIMKYKKKQLKMANIIVPITMKNTLVSKLG